MGGICGFLGSGDKSLLKRMSQELSYKGSHEDLFEDKNVGICFRSINREDGLGKSEDCSVIAAFDGKIFNAKELRSFLEAKGHRFSSDNDAELLAHLYEEYGLLAVNELRGGFSCVVWDFDKELLLLARDRVGEKSIFYSFNDKSVYFASEIRPLVYSDVIEKRLNPIGVDYFFSWGHVPAPETLFVDVKKLPPSYMLLYKHRRNERTLLKYWDLDYSKIEYDVSEDEWCRRIYRMLVESVSIRLRKGPFAILLGGLDSSAVAALMRKLTNESISSVTIMFENEEFDKSYSKYVAEWLGIEAYERTLCAKDFIRTIQKLPQIFDDLRIDLLITIPSFLALEIAKEKAKAVFTGDGADCAFWSWGWGFERTRLKVPSIRSSIRTIRKYSMDFYELRNASSKLWHALRDHLKAKVLTAHLPFELRPLYNEQYFHEDELQELLGRDLAVNVYSPFLGCLKCSAELGSKIGRMRLTDKQFEVIGGWGVERLGRICSHFHLELGTPFEDHKLRELAARIPPELKQPSPLLDKFIFRRTLLKYSLLPKEVVKQRKWGFGWELSEIAAKWFRRELKDYIEQVISDDAKLIKPLLKKNVIRKYVQKGRPIQVLSILTFILWYKRFFANN